jgi:hypothetical protein
VIGNPLFSQDFMVINEIVLEVDANGLASFIVPARKARYDLPAPIPAINAQTVMATKVYRVARRHAIHSVPG